MCAIDAGCRYQIEWGTQAVSLNEYAKMGCVHDQVTCLNEFEIIRKYRCEICREVMMCDCEEDFGRRILPHQLSEGRDSKSKERVPVTLGFQANVCRECRGLPPKAFPVAEIYGRASKIKRYYWRELRKRKLELFGEWALAHGVDPLLATDEDAKSARKQASNQALEEIKRLHESAPKYTFQSEMTLPELVAECHVEEVPLDAIYIKDSAIRHAQVQWNGEVVRVEDFVRRHYAQEGYQSLAVESVPFHVLFGIYLWLVIQDPDDEHVQVVGFGDRVAFDNGEQGEMIWCQKPDDFGSPAYGKRRKEAIDDHFTEMLQPEELDWLFDYWLEPSARLRQYLWAHRDAEIETARNLISVLPPEVLFRILRYLVESYWERYLGWPDLLLYRDDEFFFAEVKSSNDTLSSNQKRWIRDNYEFLKMPFKLVKIHKTDVVEATH